MTHPKSRPHTHGVIEDSVNRLRFNVQSGVGRLAAVESRCDGSMLLQQTGE